MLNLRAKVMFGLIFLFCISTLTIYSQKSDCFEDPTTPGRIICPIVEDNPFPLGPVQVKNESRVVVRVTRKSLLDDCALTEVKTTEIKEIDPILLLLQSLLKVSTGGVVSLANAPFGDPETVNLWEASQALKNEVNANVNESHNLVTTRLDPMAQRTKRFLASPIRTLTDYNTTLGSFPNLSGDLEALYLQTSDGSLDNLQALYASYYDRMLKLPPSPTVARIAEELNLTKVGLSKLKNNYDAINSSRAYFIALSTRLKQTDDVIANNGDPFVTNLPLLPYTQQAASTSVVCTNSISKKPTLIAPVPVTILYKKDSDLSFSVGVLLSTIPKQKLGTTAIRTGVDASGNPTFRNLFAVVDHAPVQVIPFAFLNYRIFDFDKPKDPTKKSRFTFNLSGGFGGNPNSGTTELEFFVGAGIGYKKMLFQFGDHIGRFQKGFKGGFNIGDTVPAGFPSVLPIDKEYRHGFGIAVSYKLPL